MIILDQTIVNVALPSIQEDLDFSPAGLAWVVNAYLIAFGGLLLLAGRLGDLIGRRQLFLAGLARLHARVVAVRAGRSPAMLIAARFVQGVGGALTSAVILGMIVTMFPEPREQAKAIGVFCFVALGRRVDRPAARRRPDRGAQLALDLLRQRADRRARCSSLAVRLLAREAGLGLARGRRPPGRRPGHRALMLAVYTIVDAHSLAGWALARASRCWLAFVIRQATAAKPAAAPRHPALPQRRRARTSSQMLAVAGMLGMFFLVGAVPAAGARLRRAGDRRGVPADLDHDRRDHPRLLRAADHPLRPAHRPAPGTAVDRRRTRRG